MLCPLGPNRLVRRVWLASLRVIASVPGNLAGRWSGTDPHPASAHVSVGDLHVCSSVLPWRSAGTLWPGPGNDVGSRTQAAVEPLVGALPAGLTVWGGDWNHALEGRETAGSASGREAIRTALAQLDLRAVTASLPHRLDGLSSIDHIAVPTAAAKVEASRRIQMSVDGRSLSDHDAYVTAIDWT